ncbi:uncharacterized protein LOC113358592 isoform X2 [Papaver somniferum]|uniref:uncharacterized protein LOC113358592 isoform X1 n=1 Tax=Papaver somniferum TaxID=3469 RepID=UPI000E6F4CB3|nr:uncharacterized protein LOC113358592 isoform X1 [Papaver somniferum]XP_026457974.1 uncharacterized protein LOC113358592 isoform X2 [Papaver somniferum]
MVKQRKKRKRNLENDDDDDDENGNVDTMFPVLLASSANKIRTPFTRSILKKQLQKLHSVLQSQPKPIFNKPSILSILPVLLNKTLIYPSITCLILEIIGFISLTSIEDNQRIALDAEILRGLLNCLMECKSKKKVLVSVCNAVLDVSTTWIGRAKLCQAFAVQKLISVFLQDDATAKHVVQYCMGKGSSGVDELRVLVLEATITLINTCNLKQLTEIPKELVESFLRYLKEAWVSLRDEIILKNVGECGKDGNIRLSNTRVHDLAESIFRLSINRSDCSTNCTPEVVRRNIFGPEHSEFEQFMLNYWEKSPFLFTKLSKPLSDCGDSFSSLFRSFNSKRTTSAVISSVLRGLVSCPPLPSDDLNIISFLEEVKGGLGFPMIYEQDIRVLKAVGLSNTKVKREIHYHKELTDSTVTTDHKMVDVHKCEEAFLEGYTVALRGMEFRSESIAAIADGLAVLFGQPSVGANAYLTPPQSQGLARHYDDHCVFICQLLGQKRWVVSPRQTSLLPRLYEPLRCLTGSEDGIDAFECKQFLLQEGDILYIPRGCPHEAYTVTDDDVPEKDDVSTGSSLHLTLGIEIEPPFEWEGFAHVALHCWNQKRQVNPCINQLLGGLNSVYVYLLHISIQLIGYQDSVFRKGCMVASFSLPQNKKENQLSEKLDLDQRKTFSYIVDCIDKEANFLKAFQCVEEAIQEKNEEWFQRLRWLHHLDHEGVADEGFDWTSHLEGFENLLRLLYEDREDAEATFTLVKSSFCKAVAFENVCESFEMLLLKYKRTRKHYMSGMLSLHCS